MQVSATCTHACIHTNKKHYLSVRKFFKVLGLGVEVCKFRAVSYSRIAFHCAQRFGYQLKIIVSVDSFSTEDAKIKSVPFLAL